MLIYLCTLVNVARSLLAFSISTANPLGDLVHKVYFSHSLFCIILLIFRYYLYLSSSSTWQPNWVCSCLHCYSVSLFSNCPRLFSLPGHLDSGSSIRRALVFTLILSMFHAGLQAIIDFDFLPYIDKVLRDFITDFLNLIKNCYLSREYVIGILSSNHDLPY